VDVNVGCSINPNYISPILAIYASTVCDGNAGGITFLFEGVSDVSICQGPVTWNTFELLDNATEPTSVQRNIWVVSGASLPKDPPCVAEASFALYTDAACTEVYNYMRSGPPHYSIVGIEDPSVCLNQSNSEYSGDWRSGMGSYVISLGSGTLPCWVMLAVVLFVSVVADRLVN
jgi:hypothetical protein